MILRPTKPNSPCNDTLTGYILTASFSHFGWKLLHIYYIFTYILFLETMKGYESKGSQSKTNKSEKEVFESVLQKHFQIIQTFLDKINVLYVKNEQLQVSFNNLAEKVAEIEESTSNIHYEFRTTHLQIDKKINHMNNHFRSVQEQMNMIREDLPYDKSIDSVRFTSKSAHLKGRRNKKTSFNSGLAIQINKLHNDNQSLIEQVADDQSQSNSEFLYAFPQPQTLDKINSQEISSQEKTSHRMIKTSISKFASLQQNNQTLSKLIQDNTNKYLKEYFQECPEILNNIIMAKVLHFSVTMDQKLQGKVRQQVKNDIQKAMERLNSMQLKWQTKIKENQISIQKIQDKAQSKFQMMNHESRERWDRELKKIDEEFTIIMNKVQKTNVQKLEHQVEIVKQKVFRNLGMVEQKINHKVELHYFEESMNNLSNTINLQLTNIHKFMPNRLQTHRAINFLEKKINRLIEEGEEKQQKTKKEIEDGPLRINRCDSQKRLMDLVNSHQNSRENLFDDNEPHLYRSLNASIYDNVDKDVDLNTYNAQFPEAKYHISWKKAVLNTDLSKFKQQRPKKLSITKTIKNGPTYSISSTIAKSIDKQTNAKDWKEKVVRILNAGDRKRVKVTFK